MYQLLLLAMFSIFATTTWAQADDVIEASETTQLTIKQEKVEKKEDEKKEAPSTKNVEKIEVTGSYVRRIDIEGPSPIVTIDSEEFEVAGVDTMTDYMRENPMFSSTSDSGSRDGYFNFRGQHAGSTLVLINGMRIPKLGGGGSDPGRGFYTGVENIPTNIIERVEVLKDGSSALYGSDAMAGVMNFITKKDYDGVEYSTRVNLPEIGQGLQQNHTLAFGKSYSRGNWFLTSQFVEQRGFTEKDIGNGYRPGARTVSQASEHTFTPVSQLGEAGPSTFFRGNCVESSDRDCPYNDTRGIDFVRDPRQNIGTLMSGRYDINSNMSVSMVGMYNRRQRMDYGRPGFINFSRQNDQALLSTNSLTSNKLINQTSGSDQGEVAILPIDEVGPRQIDVLQNTYSAQAKVEGYYLDTWKWDLSGSYAYSMEERNHQNGLVSLNEVRNTIQNSADYQFGGRNTNAFDSARVTGIEGYEASMTTARLFTSGELFDMNSVYGAGGPVSLAVGVEGQWEMTGDVHDASLTQEALNQQFFPNQQGTRTVNSAFMEIVAYPLQSLEVQLAGRSDTYSDFGSTFNPKLSVGFRPNNKILLRSSVGTNFNAPSVRNMIQRDFIQFQDIEVCPDPNNCNEKTIPVTRYRDPTLRPEEGVNYNFGTVIQPNKNWTFTFDQWNFEGEGMLAARSGFDYSNLYESLGFDDEALAEQAGVTWERNSSGEIVGARFPSVRNMGTRVIRGIDLNAAFNSPVRLFGRVMKLNARFDQTHMLVRKTKFTEDSEFVNYGDMEWKNTTSLSLNTQRHGYRFAARTLPGDTGNRGQTRTQTMYDFNYNYRIPWWTASMSFGVKNLFDSRVNIALNRDFIDYTSGFNASQFQPLGRRYYVGYRQSF